MDDTEWLTVGKPKKIKSGENKAAIEKLEDEENLKLILEMAMNARIGKTEIAAPVKKTQIPVKVKNEQKPPKPKKKTEPQAVQTFTFKSLQAALHALDIADMQIVLGAAKAQFNNDVINLKTAVAYLNDKLRLEKADDVMFFDKPLDYPLSILPTELKVVLKELIEKTGEESLKYFFHNLLQSLCEELNKSRNFVGNLLLLQQIAHHLPEVCISNLASTVILRNSYQNQPSICLSLFWALVSSGFSDTFIGLKVWIEIVSSMINVKSYTKFSLDCLHKILIASAKTPDLNLNSGEYKSVIEVLVANEQKLKSKDFQKTKASCVSLLTKKVVKSLEPKEVEPLLNVLFMYCKRNPESFTSSLVDLISSYPEECVELWKTNFDAFSRSSVFVFNYLDNNLKEAEKLIEHRSFRAFIKQIDYLRYPNFLFVRDIPAKMTDKKNQKKQKKSEGCSSCCKWVFGSFVLFSAITGLIVYDTNVLHNGKFEESSVGRVLKQSGTLPHFENAYFVTMKYSARGYKWTEENAPIAYSKSRTYMQPFCDFTKDLGLTAFNVAVKGWESTKLFAAEKTPVVLAFIDQYAPGWGQKIHDFVVNTSKGFCSLTCGTWKQTVDFFKTKVFIGQLSPESFGKVFNSNAERAKTYYSWFHEKVDTYAKLK